MTSQRFFMKYRGLYSDQGRQAPYHALYWPANLRTLPRLRHISQHNPRLLSTMKLRVPSLTKLVALHPTAAKHQISTFQGTTVHPKVMLGHHCTLDTLALRLETSVLTGTEKAPARNSWHAIKKTASQNPKIPLHISTLYTFILHLKDCCITTVSQTFWKPGTNLEHTKFPVKRKFHHLYDFFVLIFYYFELATPPHFTWSLKAFSLEGF